MTPGKISEKTTRTNIYISASAMANLKKLSEQNMGAPVAELIRRAGKAGLRDAFISAAFQVGSGNMDMTK